MDCQATGLACMDRKKQITQFFGKHAAAYTPAGHPARQDLDRLIALMSPTGAATLLDVATAAGNAALALAPLVRRVVGVDLTPEMGRQFMAQAEERAVTNADFIVADVERLPFHDGAFDFVTCRRAAHHFPDPAAAMAEMARVLRPGGKLGLSDQSAPEDPRAAALCNDMERARDPSHGRALSPSEWQRVAESAGLRVQAVEGTEDPAEFSRWLFPVAPDGPEGAQALALVESAPAEVSSQMVRRESGQLFFLKRRVVLVALKV